MSSRVYIHEVAEADRHRLTAIAALEGILAERGAKSIVAEKAGMTPQYLSNILDITHHAPSPEIAEQLVAVLPVDKNLRHDILEHLIASRDADLRFQQAFDQPYNEEWIAQQLVTLQDAHATATFAHSLAEAYSAYRSIVRIGEKLLRKIDHTRQLFVFAQVALILHDAYAVVNRQTHALLVAMRARDFFELASWEWRQVQDFTYLEANLEYAIMISYGNLNWKKRAYEFGAGLDAKLNKSDSPIGNLWRPHAHRQLIKAVRYQPRFAVSELEGIYAQSQKIFEGRNDPFDNVLDILAQIALIEGYVAYALARNTSRQLKISDQMLADLLPRFEQESRMGAIHRVVCLESCARMSKTLGRLQEFEYFLVEAWQIAKQAGLLHQQQKLHHLAGDAIFRELGLL